MTNIKFLLLIVWRCLWRGRAAAKITHPSRIAVIQTGKLGDMISTTPVFRAMKEFYPGACVWVVGDRINGELLAHNRDVDHYLVYQKNPWQIIEALREARIDVGVSIGPSPDTMAMLYLAGARLVVAPQITNGYTPLETRAGRFIKKFVVSVPLAIGAYAPREYLKLLEPLGIKSSNTRKHLDFSKEASERVRSFLSEHGLEPQKDVLVGIVPGTGYTIKLWPCERFAEVAAHTQRTYGAVIVLLGTRSDRLQVDELIGYLKMRSIPYLDTAGVFTVDEFKALVSLLSLVVGVDTGPIYVAEAFGVATIDIVGPMDQREQPPVGPRHRVVVDPDRKKPMIHIMNTVPEDPAEARRQVDAITVEMVIKAVDELMAGLQ